MIKRCMTIAAACLATLCIAGALVGCSSSSYNPELSGSSTLSSSDLVSAGTLTVGVNTNNPPLAGQTSAKLIGIDVDVAGAIGDQIGLPVKVIDVGSNALSALKSGACDVVLGVDVSNTESELSKSSTYLPTGIALFSKSQNATIPTADSKTKIGVQGSSVSAWTMNEQFGSDSVVVETDLATAFKDLQTGTIDYVAADAVVGMYAARTAGVDAYVVAIVGSATGYTAGCLTSKTNVKKAVDTAISTIVGNGVMDVIETKWLGTTLNLSNIKAITTASETATTDASTSTSTSTTN